jgi:hypothetical protein
MLLERNAGLTGGVVDRRTGAGSASVTVVPLWAGNYPLGPETNDVDAAFML